MAESFLQACKAGSCADIDRCLESNDKLVYVKDEDGRTGPLIAAFNGNWQVLIHLLVEYHVSPHAIDVYGNGIYHYLVNGTIVKPATDEDLENIKSHLKNIWEDDYRDTLTRLQEHRAAMADKRPPTKILLHKPSELLNEFFGLPKTFLAKFILHRFHVIVDRKNIEGKIPSQYAIDHGEFELAAIYETATDYHPCRRRLLQGLNDAIIRQVASYL
jgi:ankyrin repeat protein